MSCKEADILGDIEDLAHKLANDAWQTTYNVLEAKYYYDVLSDKTTVCHEDDEVDIFEETLDNASEELSDALDGLRRVDESLVKMLALRLKLAELTGIPLNLSGGKTWVRLVEHLL